ncbi:DUF3343 domain-containing protein [Gudongella oleilytica]|uniref:DUF3343 domain-containing protein n=1 Tax=Gudongella oleilytica TaxID=1582259 RepID=UPI000FF8B3AD|nr:DUF3343 domain-containing protein [Gudongella oleilytica]
MKREEYGIITFESTHHAMAAESYLKDQGILTKTIPTPRDITLSCGLSIMIIKDDIERVKEFRSKGDFRSKAIYSLVIEDGNRKLEMLE